MLLKSYFSFFFKNYFRSHRYLREILLTIIFNVFFWGFLYSDKPEDTIWTVFGVFGLLLTMVTVPSVFYLEKKNSVYFTLVRKSGRRNFFFSKILWATFFKCPILSASHSTLIVDIYFTDTLDFDTFTVFFLQTLDCLVNYISDCLWRNLE